MTAALPAAGTFLMAGLPGPTLDPTSRDLIARYGCNNFILFRRNVTDPQQLRRLCAGLADCCRDHGLAPPLIAIDQEGGTVARLPEPFTQFGDARGLARAGDPQAAALAYARDCAADLVRVGINCNLAPVLDVCPRNGSGPWLMERRCLSDDPLTAARLGRTIITAMQEQGVAACAKHFPGLGSARLDPHTESFAIDKPATAILREDLIPFVEAIASGVAAVMTSHTHYPDLDPHRPATLSHAILTSLLRNKLGFSGVCITDDLEMGAITGQMSVAKAALLAFLAGADLLLVCSDQRAMVECCRTLEAAMAGGTVPRQRCHEAAGRLAALRDRFAAGGLTAAQHRPSPSTN